ncbi:hypothetical protein LJC20_05730 [Eubacteriales bacterium OttesenSCG-928-M02]|nr:hypothetical protein [Eubacteriales bacterium OttesenSCG-928-M02]
MLIQNGSVFFEDAYHQVDVRCRDGKIVEIGENLTGEEQKVDATGLLVFPGFLDTHIHGFNTATCVNGVQDVKLVAKGLPAFGVTGYIPTFSEPDAETTVVAVRYVREAGSCPGARMLGMHIDMPYRNRGGHYAAIKTPPTKAHTLSMVDGDLSDIRILCAAPELPGAMEWFSWVAEQGVVAEIGNTMCTATQIRQAADHGATLLNHFYNGYAQMDHHENGAIVGALLEDRLYAQLNCDGIHVAEEFIKLTIRVKGTHLVAPVTDCSHFQGMEEGEYTYGKKEIARKVFYKDGAVRDEAGKLVTGAHPFDENMRTLKSFGYTLEEIGTLCAETPAKSVQITDRGKIAVGRLADFAILSPDLYVQKTIMDGKIVYEK